MDPITTAIIAAVAAGITDIGKKAVGDAYQGLKTLIKSKFGQENKISKAITELEASPEAEGRKQILAETVAQQKAAQDPELLNIAKELIRALQESESGRQALAKYQIDARNAQIGVMGDHAKVEGGIHFGGGKQ